ncbi:MAG: hypothetical protein ACD_80C00046G0005 [uncultured bacterium (gcode 4)]|uniref:Phosphate propanoyltransferase n=1 Tax=uncultured bacterium (gcode 4) TaxID=1234023 RepID=K1XYQ3_9BACT|nr:MAG: hypothetical protein ACD_80C00046G0005 [uncultured bacterium (gcode 4)]
MRLPIGISNRHVYLSQVDVEKLFGRWYQLTKLRDMTQPGQFACNETVILSWPNGRINTVRVVGPTRKESHVEILMWDNFVLGTQAPVRSPRNFTEGENIIIIGPEWEFYLSHNMIVAQRHLHCTTKEAIEMWLKNWDKIKIKISWPRGLIFEEVLVMTKDDYILDFHIDIEEANAAWVSKGGRWEIVK